MHADEQAVNPYDANDPAAITQLKKHLQERWDTANYRRGSFELMWCRNVLFHLGVQWIRVDHAQNTIKNLPLQPGFPRVIENKYAQVMNDLMSAVVQGDVPLIPAPATDDPDDIATAKVIERVRQEIDIETQTNTIKHDLGFWYVLTGNAFTWSYYDYDPRHGTTPVEMYACQYCGYEFPLGKVDLEQPCPQCSNQNALVGMEQQPPSYAPALDDTGTPKIAEMPKGKCCKEVLSPFEVYWDNTIRAGSGLQTWFFRPHRYDVETARSLWSHLASKIHENMPEKFKVSRNYLLTIAFAGSMLSQGGDLSDRKQKKQLTAWEYYELPCAKYPQGLCAVLLGEEVVELSPLKTQWSAGEAAGQAYIPLTHFCGEPSGGAWGWPRASYLVPMQARRNILASSMQLTAQRTGTPKLLEPYGSGVQNVVGAAGQRLQYKPISFGGTTFAKPEYLEAALGNTTPFLLQIERIDAMMETLAGTRFIQGGDVPPGVTAASALSFLNEKANKALAPVKERWAEGWRQSYRYAIECARQNWTDERTLTLLGKDKMWQFEKFKGADFKGAADMVIDYEALYPKSQATERANIFALGQLGFIAPEDAEQRRAVYEAFGQSKLQPTVHAARQQAIREFDRFMNQDEQPVLLPIVQDSAIHLQQHRLDAQSQEFEELMRTDKAKADIWIAHIQATALDVQMAQAAAQPMPEPGGEKGAQKGSQKGSNKESGQQSLGQENKPAAVKKGEDAAADEPPPLIQ